jgi:hypothetical protein
MSLPPILPRKIQDKKDSIQQAYWEKKMSRKTAAGLLFDLGFEEWEVNLYLDNDQTGLE